VHPLAPGRKGYVHTVRGEITVNGHRLSAGDALKSDGGDIAIDHGSGAELLLFDLPGDWPPA